MNPNPLKENGPFKTDNLKQLAKSFVIGVLHNLVLTEEELEKLEVANVIRLNPIDLSLETFHRLFYDTHTKYFTINNANSHNDLILFNKQTYSSNHHHKVRYSVNDQLLHSYSLAHNVDVENINPVKKIKLSKESFQIQSLGKLYGSQYGHDWDHVIHALIEGNHIKRSSNALSFVVVPFEIHVNIFSKSLNVWTSVVFVYRVKLNGYVNDKEDSNDLINSYSQSSSEKPFYTSGFQANDFAMNDYDEDSDNGANQLKSSNSDNDEQLLEHELNELPIEENKKKATLETLKEQDEDEDEYLDENSVIYTINNDLLNKINQAKHDTDESICTWLKN
jgi:hypothetical protein